MSQISPGERRELRSVVRQQFKVLRTEVKQREVELDAESERIIADRYRKVDGARDDIQRFYETLRRTESWWKPTPQDRTRALVKAGALIAAEIDRLMRLNGGNDAAP